VLVLVLVPALARRTGGSAAQNVSTNEKGLHEAGLVACSRTGQFVWQQ
jgi:hypothetical protein